MFLIDLLFTDIRCHGRFWKRRKRYHRVRQGTWLSSKRLGSAKVVAARFLGAR